MSAQVRLAKYKEEKKEEAARAELRRLEEKDASQHMDEHDILRWRAARDEAEREAAARKTREERDGF